MINSFNAKIATDYNPNISIFIQELAQWTFYNLANKRNIYDGYCWSYNTLEAYEKIFPWWNRRQLETLINNAVKEGLVIKGNYNKNKYDRTCWYTLSYKAMAYYPELITDDFLMLLSTTISQKWEMQTQGMTEDEKRNFHFTKMRNGVHENVTPIPSTIPSSEISKDISYTEPSPKPSTNKVYTTNDLMLYNPHEIPEQMLQDFMTNRKSKKSKVTPTAWEKINKTLYQIEKEVGIKPVAAFETMVANCWQSIDVKYFKEDNKRNGTPKSREAIL